MTNTAPSSMTSPVLRRLRDYWLALKGDREMPARQDIDPLDIPSLLPNTFLVDVIGAPPQFRYRLIGTRVTEIANRDATGRFLDEDLYGADTERMLTAYWEMMAARAPAAVREIVQFVRKDWIKVEALLMPLSTDGRDIDMVLGGVDVIDEAPGIKRREQRQPLDWKQ